MRGPDRTVKVQSAGPLTLAAQLELATGLASCSTAGRCANCPSRWRRELRGTPPKCTADSACRWSCNSTNPRFPMCSPGHWTGRTILETVPAWPEPEALDVLDRRSAAPDCPSSVHCCAGSLPADLLRRSAAEAVAFDLTRVSRADLDGIGELFDSGTALVLGLVPSTAPNPCRAGGSRRHLPWNASTVSASLVPRCGQVSVAPTCGLAGGGPALGAAGTEVGARDSAALSVDPETL